jgi:hypothetical protein
MKVVVNEKSLLSAIEDLVSESRSIQSTRIDTIAGDVEDDGDGFGGDEPIEASPVMSHTQIVVDRPPVEDEKFMPATLQELSKSAFVIAQEVPDDQIPFFYSELHKLLDRALDKHDASASSEEPEPTFAQEQEEDVEAQGEDIPDEEDAIRESKIKDVISLILEQDDDSEFEDISFTSLARDSKPVGSPAHINSVVINLLSLLHDLEAGYEGGFESVVVSPGKTYKRPMSLERMRIDVLNTLMNNKEAQELLGELTPEAQKTARIRVLDEYTSNWEEMFTSPEEMSQLDVTAKVGMEVKKTRSELSSEDYIEYLLDLASKEDDPQRRKAYEVLAQLAKKNASGDEHLQPIKEPEVLTPEQQIQSDLEKAERDAKKLDSLAPYFGFKNASGIRQWRRKFAEPKFKAMIGSATGISAYKDYFDQIQDNFQMLAMNLADLVEKSFESLKNDSDLTPGEKEFMEGISHVNDQFQAMVAASQESADGYLPSDMLDNAAGRLLRVAFKNVYYDKQFIDFAREMKKHIVEFLEDRQVNSATANIFAKMFNGETDLISLDSDSPKAKKLEAGGITQEIYDEAKNEEQEFIKQFFGNLGADNKKYLATINDRKKLKEIFLKAIDEESEWEEREKTLDAKLKDPLETEESLEENFKNIVRSIMRM